MNKRHGSETCLGFGHTARRLPQVDLASAFGVVPFSAYSWGNGWSYNAISGRSVCACLHVCVCEETHMAQFGDIKVRSHCSSVAPSRPGIGLGQLSSVVFLERWPYTINVVSERCTCAYLHVH